MGWSRISITNHRTLTLIENFWHQADPDRQYHRCHRHHLCRHHRHRHHEVPCKAYPISPVYYNHETCVSINQMAPGTWSENISQYISAYIE